ncbi:MAG: DUF6497 family protein [Pseudomonadota bacterium]
MLLAYPQVKFHTVKRASRDSWSAGFAAPSGRTLLTGGWGCIFTLTSTPLAAFDVPSGQPLEFQESFYERRESGSLWARFRFVMPAIGEGVAYAEVAEDFLELCQVYVVPALDGQDAPDQVIISLADRPTEFGVAAPDVTQYFEAFRLEGSSCIWEGF